jgi:peptidoglycan/xylan/chitin deacetylase (PgdA/CDA1 family)
VNARVLSDVNKLGYVAVRWTVDTLGWKGTDGGQSVQTVISRVLGGLGPGEIVLMHVGSAPDHTTLDASALPQIIDSLRARLLLRDAPGAGWLMRDEHQGGSAAGVRAIL